MKNGDISEQLQIQEKQHSDNRENTQIDMNTNVQFDISADKQENKQIQKHENKHSANLADLELSSTLGLFMPDITKGEEQQTPMKRKKKKPNRSFKR